MNSSKDVEEKEKPHPSRSTHHLGQHEMDRAIVELREEHERNRRYALTDSVRQHRKDRETERAKYRDEYAVAQLQNERDILSLVDEPGTARVEIYKLSGEVSILRD